MMQEKYVDSTFAKIYYKESFRLLVFTDEDKPPNHPNPPPPALYGAAAFKNTSVC